VIPQSRPRDLVPNCLFTSSLSAVLAWHCRRYPLLRAQDIYKLIHQGVFGPGHIISSAAAARRALVSEIAELEGKSQKAKAKRQNPDEEMFEPIDPGVRLVRMNLRPWVAAECRSQNAEGRRQNCGLLAEALVASARQVKDDPALMKRRLAAAVRWCRKNLPRQAAELARVAARAEESGYPALHHSPEYSRAYRPAYRVVLGTCLNPRVRLNHKGRTKREVKGEKLEYRAGSGTSDIEPLASSF